MLSERTQPTLAIVNAKGGSGKTTTAVHLSVALADQGYEVLAIDADAQHVLTRNLGVMPQHGIATVHDVLFGNLQAREVAVTVRERLRLVPASLKMANVDVELALGSAPDIRLRKGLRERDWDVCIIDCPPNLGKITYNAMTAADYLLVPIDSAYWALEGLDLLMDTADDVRSNYNPGLRLLGAVLTRWDKTNLSRSVMEAVKERWPRETMSTVIRSSVKYREAAALYETIFDNPNGDLHADYRALTREVLSRLGLVRDVVRS